jgi:hypothetical protein
MGREIVYCWKCASRLQGDDFDSGKAFRVGDQVSCPDCIDELIADLSAEEQEAILHPPKPRTGTQGLKKITSTKIKAVEKRDAGVRRPITSTPAARKTGTTGPVPRLRTGNTGPVPTASTGVRKKVTAPIPKVQPPPEEPAEEGAEEGGEKPPMDEKKKRLLLLGGIGGGLFLIIVVLLIVVLTRKEPPKKKHNEEASEETKPKVTAGPVETSKEKEIKALLKAAFDLKKDKPDELGLQLKKFREAEKAADGTAMASDVSTAIDDVLAKIAKSVSALDEQVLPQYKARDYKPVIEAYEKAKDLHDVPEWKEKIEAKLKLVRNNIEDAFHQIKKAIELAQQNGEDPKIDEAKSTVAKWEMPEFTEKLNKFLDLLAVAGTPEPTKNPEGSAKNPPPSANVRQLSPAMKSFMPMWQTAMTLAFSRDYAAAATEMSGAATRADSDEAKKAASEDVESLKAIGERYQEFLKSAAETPKLTALTLEYQDKPGEWKKVAGKTVKVDPTRLEFQPDTPKDGKTPAPILIEFTDLNAGSLATLYKARKKTLSKKDADLLTMFALLEGALESAQGLGGTAPDRYWVYAAEAREKAPKPSSREFEARILFHQSEFEWRKMPTRYAAIEKCKQLLGDYNGTLIVRKYQPLIKDRSETGKEYTFLPDKLLANGDYNTFKNLKKDEPAWIASKGIDFKDSLYNYVEAEFVALPGLSYRCWVYAGGCCQEVWNGSYQVSEQTTSNRGKQVSIDPGSQMAAPLPYPSGLKKTHEDHKPKTEKGKPPPPHPKTAAKWEWISIPMPKTFASPGAKSVRILTDQEGFGVKYVIISSSRPKPPDDLTAKDLAKESLAGPGSGKPEIKGTSEPKEWLIIGPFPDGLTKEQPPEKEVDLTKEYPGKSGAVKWKLASPTMKGPQAHFDWEKGPFTPKDAVSVYALIHVKAPSAMDAKLWLSHDDGGRAWVNGALVHDKNKTGAAVKPDEFSVAIKLEEGWNRILIKVNNTKDTFGLMMRITDPAKTPIQALEYSPYGDMLEPP